MKMLLRNRASRESVKTDSFFKATPLNARTFSAFLHIVLGKRHYMEEL